MPRNIDTATQSELNNQVTPLAVMVDLTLNSGTNYIWSGYGDLVYNGNTYKGVGQLGKISSVTEENAVYASGAQMSLEAIDPTTLSEGLQDIAPMNPTTIYLAVMGAGGIVGTPVVIFSGMTDQASIVDSVKNATLTIDIESKLSQLKRNREYRYTDQMQRFLYPNDGAFKYVNMLADYLGTWGFKNGNS